MPSLKYQLKAKLSDMLSIGESKHQAKKEERELQEMNGEKVTNAAPGIYSYKTYKDYLINAKAFAAYLQENHKEIKKINEIKPDHANEYLKHLWKTKNWRPATIQTKAAAIAKVMGWHCNQINEGLPKKCSAEPQKGRNKVNPHFSIENHGDVIGFISNTGCRKSETMSIMPEQIKKDAKGDVYLDFMSKREYQVMTKGGRARKVTMISKEYQKRMWTIKEEAEKRGYKTIWQNVSESAFQHMEAHSYRREYAQNLYKTLVNKYIDKYGYAPPGNYVCRGKHAGETYNRQILRQVSQQLGHNRCDVVINNYFR